MVVVVNWLEELKARLPTKQGTVRTSSFSSLNC